MRVAYDANVALAGVDVRVEAGSVVGVIGPNGSGKSTLLKTIAGVLRASRGEILLGGRPIREAAARIAFVPQREEVNWDFPVTARDVVLMGRYRSAGWFRWPGRDDRQLAEGALEAVGLGGLGHRHISQFSGGQQQRIFMARAMVQEPALVLLDEPFTGVDVQNRAIFQERIQAFARAGIAVLVATHDLDEVSSTTTHVLCLNRTMTAFGPTATTFTPETLKRTFGGQLAIFEERL